MGGRGQTIKTKFSSMKSPLPAYLGPDRRTKFTPLRVMPLAQGEQRQAWHGAIELEVLDDEGPARDGERVTHLLHPGGRPPVEDRPPPTPAGACGESARAACLGLQGGGPPPLVRARGGVLTGPCRTIDRGGVWI